MITVPACRLKSDAGFTLLEMLVSLLLLALAAACLPGALRLAEHAMQSADALAGAPDALSTRDFLSERISQAHPWPRREENGSMTVDFAGTERTLSFVAPAPMSMQTMAPVRYRMGRGADAGSPLTISVDPLVLAGPPEEVLAEVRLSSSTPLTLRYFGRKRGDTTAQWHDTWIGEVSLPQLIEVAGLPGVSASPAVQLVPLRLASPH